MDSAKLSLDGRVAAVTGAGSGIGLATARALAEQGASVLVTGRTEPKLVAAVSEIPGTARYLVLDVADTGAGERMVAAALESFGSLDIVVANAGVYLNGDVWEADPAAAARLIGTNVTGLFDTVGAAIRHMRGTGRGDIVVTSSVSGHQAIHWEPVYSASKHAVQAFVHGVRRQLVGSGVRIGAVAPGVVLNDLWHVTSAAEIEVGVGEGTGLRSEDVADAIIYMLTRPRHVQVRDLVLLPVNQPI